MPEKKTVNLDFREADPDKVELLPAGFTELGRRANAGTHPTALGGMAWPPGAPVVWFVVCMDEGRYEDAVHLAVCADEETARAVTERIAEEFVAAGVAQVRPA
jgi:hypothetical protein